MSAEDKQAAPLPAASLPGRTVVHHDGGEIDILGYVLEVPIRITGRIIGDQEKSFEVDKIEALTPSGAAVDLTSLCDDETLRLLIGEDLLNVYS